MAAYVPVCRAVCVCVCVCVCVLSDVSGGGVHGEV